MVKKFAVIGVVLDNPHDVQKEFNEIVSDFSHIVKGRMGLPFESHSVAVISIIVLLWMKSTTLQESLEN